MSYITLKYGPGTNPQTIRSEVPIQSSGSPNRGRGRGRDGRLRGRGRGGRPRGSRQIFGDIDIANIIPSPDPPVQELVVTPGDSGIDVASPPNEEVMAPVKDPNDVQRAHNHGACGDDRTADI